MPRQRKSSLIIGFLADLIFSTRIESVAQKLGYATRWFGRLEEFSSQEQPTKTRQHGEHLIGSGADLLESITDLQPILLIFDLSNNDIPWRDWISLIKSAPASRRIPVLCYGPHVEGEAFVSARKAGADKIVARSRFIQDLPNLIINSVRIPDYEGIDSACMEDLSSIAIEGIELFNRGEYFEAHERLEDAWNAELNPGKEFYRALLQTAVAFLQIERMNYNGARKMFLRLRQWLYPLPETCRGVDIRQLRTNVTEVYDVLLSLGEERVDQFDLTMLRSIKLRYEK